MHKKLATVQALIKDMLAEDSPPVQDDTLPFGYINHAHEFGIDDGRGYGSQALDETPAWIKQDERGWRKLVTLK